MVKRSLTKKIMYRCISCEYFSLMIFLFIFSVNTLADWSASVDRKTISLNDTFQLTLRATEGSRNTPEPNTTPLEKDFEILGVRTNTNYQMINGHANAWTDWVYTLSPKKSGTIVVPPIQKGSEKTAPISLVVDQRNTIDQTTQPIVIQTTLSNEKPYVQQETVLNVRILRKINLIGDKILQAVKVEDAIVEQMEEPKEYSKIIDGLRYIVTEIRYAIYPQKSGTIIIPPVIFESSIPMGNIPGGFFPITQSKPIRAQSNILQMQVQSIPDIYPVDKPWLPAKSLSLTESWSKDPDSLKVGDSVTRTLSIVAEGLSINQLSPISYDNIDGLKIYPDKTETEKHPIAQGQSALLKQAFALVPTQPGRVALPAIEYTWFNTTTKQVETTRIEERVLHIQGIKSINENPVPYNTLVNQETQNALSQLTDSLPQENRSSLEKNYLSKNSLTLISTLETAILLVLAFAFPIVFFKYKKLQKQLHIDHEKTILKTSHSIDQTFTYNQLIENLRKNDDLKNVRSHLHAYLCNLIKVDNHASSLLQCCQHINNDALTQEVIKLEQSLFSKHKEPNAQFDCKRLISIVKQLNKIYKKQDKSADTNDIILAELYPTSR